jgi:hypothetical protein
MTGNCTCMDCALAGRHDMAWQREQCGKEVVTPDLLACLLGYLI